MRELCTRSVVTGSGAPADSNVLYSFHNVGAITHYAKGLGDLGEAVRDADEGALQRISTQLEAPRLHPRLPGNLLYLLPAKRHSNETKLKTMHSTTTSTPEFRKM